MSTSLLNDPGLLGRLRALQPPQSQLTPVSAGDDPGTPYYNEGTREVSPSWGDEGATDTYAALGRAQWEDYVNRYLPIQWELLRTVDDTNLLNQQVQRNTQLARGRINAAAGSASRQAERYGTQLSAPQAQAQQAETSRTGALAQIDAANRTRQAKKERDMQLLAGNQSFASDTRTQLGSQVQ